MLISGAGVGLMIPTLTGAGASSLAPERFATGAAVLTMGRQIGVALGVAVLVAVLGTSATSAADFHTRVADHRRRRRLPPASRWPRSGRRVECARDAGDPARPAIAEPIADPLIAEPLVEELA